VSDIFFTKDENTWKNFKQTLSPICINTDFHSKYKTLKKIGEGSFGSVYKVKSMAKDGKEYAVKQFDKSIIQKSKMAKHFLLKEIEIMRNLDHPGI